MARTRIIAGVRFVSTGDGHYRSECGGYGLFHMFRGTVLSSWELFQGTSESPWDKLIDLAPALSEIVLHGKRGWFKLVSA